MRLALFFGAAFSFFLVPIHGQDLSRPLIGDFMGINGHTVQFKPSLYSPTGRLVRDYHPVEWDLGKDTAVLPAFPEAKNRVNWESVYGSWKKEGYSIDVCLMFESVKKENWADLPGNARAYGEYFAKEFGPSGARKLADSVEIGNEPGKWSDEDYRTILASMGKGIRAGDPKLPIATCNLTAGPSHDYAKSVACLEGLDPFYDVLTLHTYAQLEGWPTWKCSFPEDPALKDYLGDVEKICRWRDGLAVYKPVWITEFGYDSSTQSPVKDNEFKKWVGVNDVQQAQWLVRSFLVFSAMPVQRAYLYFFNDNDEPMLHASAGLTRKFMPKPSYYAVAHLYRTLKDYRYSKTIRDEKNVRIQEYQKGSDPAEKIWVAWSPTGTGIEREVAISGMPGHISEVEVMPLQVSGTVDGNLSRVRDLGGSQAEIRISESPVYLFFDRNQ